MSFFITKTSSGHIKVHGGRIVTTTIIGFILIILLMSCWVSVPAGFTGVPVTFGKVADYT